MLSEEALRLADLYPGTEKQARQIQDCVERVEAWRRIHARIHICYPSIVVVQGEDGTGRPWRVFSLSTPKAPNVALTMLSAWLQEGDKAENGTHTPTP